MANKSVRRAKRPSAVLRTTEKRSSDDTAKFLQRIENVAKATRKSERRRKLLEGE